MFRSGDRRVMKNNLHESKGTQPEDPARPGHQLLQARCHGGTIQTVREKSHKPKNPMEQLHHLRNPVTAATRRRAGRSGQQLLMVMEVRPPCHETSTLGP